MYILSYPTAYFWGVTPLIVLQYSECKKILRIMTNLKKKDSCRELFKTMDILPTCSQYQFSLLLYVVNNKHVFTKNLEAHTHDTRFANTFHQPITNLIKYQKGAN
jgi:hypothetical protein